MRHDQYRFRFYLNASHGIYLGGELGEIHPHTWEIVLNVLKTTEDFSPFHEVEKMCDAYLSNYQDVLINEIPPFTTINPTLENLAAYFKEEIQKRLRERGWLLLSIELSETPARTYIITTTVETLDRGFTFDIESEETLQNALDNIVNKKDSPSKQKENLQEEDIEWEEALNKVGKRISKTKSLSPSKSNKRSKFFKRKK